ncbi:MAG TPA: hypothetical protein EYG34_01220 [Acidimicrobiia bacterium]|jgi:monoamine oxidase|nr:hypothetical protein [Acidimicrobiia bacterium]HIL45729.1 hypothetical protein [Acidimicrobiia bacterium]
MATSWEEDQTRGGGAVSVGGYLPLFQDTNTDLDIRLSTAVSSINHAASEVQVATNSGEFTADSVVITLPLGVLPAGTVSFNPALPLKQQSAVDNLGIGLINKVVLKFKNRFGIPD